MRIGHYVSHFPHPGGTTTAMIGLSGGLIRMGHRVVAYGHGNLEQRPGSDEMLRRAEALGIEVPELRHGTVSVVTMNRRIRSRLAANKDRLDVLVIHGVFGLSFTGLERACRRGGIPCVACPNDPYSSELFRTRKILKTIYWYLRERPFLRRMRAIQVLAPSHAGYLHARGITVPVFAIPNGLELDQLEPPDGPGVTDESLPQSLEAGGLRILYFGRWDVYNKGLDLMLEAIAADPTLRSAVTLQVGGKGSDRDRDTLQRMVTSLGLDGQVSLVGFLPDIRAAIRSADYAILPSRFDGFAQAVIEALALGTPVIVSRRAGSSEFFQREHGALLSDPDVPSLVRAMREALESKGELQEAARASRPRLAQEFNWDEVARRWVEEAKRTGVLDGRASR